MIDNPYESPKSPDIASPGEFMAAASPGLVGHVRIVAVLMIIQGALELLVGIVLVALSAMLPWMMQQSMRQGAEGPAQNDPASVIPWLMTAMYAGLGVVILASAGLYIVAGIRNYRFRGRLLGIVALGLGTVSVMTCYCAPTAIALAVYGLIVLLNPQVIQAFEMSRQGQSSGQIQATFQ